jgi:hypothetical protein
MSARVRSRKGKMQAERWKQIEALYQAALPLTPITIR